ncbi:MAG TPA: potassium channel protein [Longimicrobium sp.]|nr:potassium channel protein [Longimicrobium sp.]
MDSDLLTLRRRLGVGAAFLVAVLLVGLVGYRLLAPEASWVDILYMTVITLTTVGYGEVFHLSPAGRVFTIVLLLFGISGAGYFLSTATAFLLEGQLSHVFWRRRMTREISRLSGHQIVCGSDETALYAARELHSTRRDAVLVCDDPGRAEALRREFPAMPVVIGDPTADEVLAAAGIGRASGILVCTGSDKDNLIATLTARHLNPTIRIVARVEDVAGAARVRNVGADAVVSPNFIGGLRMVSELIRPTVVTFLDEMLRDREKNLRIEEVEVDDASPLVGRVLGDLELRAVSSALLLACRQGGAGWIYNPPPTLPVAPGLVLILMGSPEDVAAVRAAVSGRFVEPVTNS